MREIFKSQSNKLGWYIIAFLILIAIIRWFQIVPPSYVLSSNYAFFSSLGRLSALIAVILFSINFILSTRLKALEPLFGGLNKVYLAHHIVGGVALIMILIHPLSLAFRFVPDQMSEAARFLLPTLGNSANTAINLGFAAFALIVLLLIVTFFGKFPYQLWRFSHKFLGLAFVLVGLHVLFISSDVSSDSFLHYYILAIVVFGLAAYIYRTLLGNILIKRYKYVVESIISPADNILTINMRPVGEAIPYKAGQFVFVKFIQDGIAKEAHPFSISSAPKKGMSITVKNLGDYTADLSNNLKSGATAIVEGAFGRFSYSGFDRPKQIWVAGGIGVTPFISMATELARQKSSRHEIHLFYSVNNKSELISNEGFKRLANIKGLNFHYHSFINDIEGRYIDVDYIADKTDGLYDSDLFICGPPQMMKGLRTQFINSGVSNKNIHTEEFSIL